MFLKQLIIGNHDEVIRDIKFHKGINLIVDSTKPEDKKSSGNNVGKTTVLKLIDFCFGGEPSSIYLDPEFRTPNHDVESYLKENNIVITLILKSDLDDESSQELTIRRNFLSRNKKIQEINGIPEKNGDFTKKLKKLIFESSFEKPTFRQVISKNIRDDENRVKNTLKVLHPTTTKGEYEALYLFWLGIDLASSQEKQQLLSNKKTEEDLQRRLKNENNISQIEQSLIIINRSIENLEERKDTFSINPDYNNNLNSLNKRKENLNHLSSRLNRLSLRKTLIIESKEELESDFSIIELEKVKSLYQNAKKYIPNIQKSFEDTLKFHNEMIKEKIRYITSELPVLDGEIIQIKSEIQQNLDDEEELTRKLKKSNYNDELQQIITELNELYEKKGNLEEQKRLWESTETTLDQINQSLQGIDNTISNLSQLIQERITKFNEYFAAISYKLYGEHFVLSSQKNEKGLELVIDSLSGKLGTGKKKGQIVAFDLAYLKFADELNIKCLHFILLDQIENVHDNQISNLLLKIISDVNGQYVLPVLVDKLPSDIDIDTYKILSLSQDDKLFKV